MAGCNVINMFSTAIFSKLVENDNIPLQMDIKTINSILGGTGFVGAFLANFTVAIFSRRSVLMCGHFFILLGHFLIFLFIQMESSSNCILFAMVMMILAFQLSNGTIVFLYISEVVVDAAMGVCLLMLLFWLVLQSLTCESLFEIEGFGVKGVFLSLCIL